MPAELTTGVFVNSLRFYANVGSMQFTQRQRPPWRKWRPLLAAILVGLLLGLAGPFGSYPTYPTATRYAFWLGMTMAGVVCAIGAEATLPLAKFRAGVVRIGAVAILSALPMTFVAAWTMSVVQPGRVFAPQQLPVLFACVAVVQLLIVYAIKTTAPTDESSDAGVSSPSVSELAPEPASFPLPILSKLPPAIGNVIIALETEDHYLRVHTSQGNALILMWMADAVALLDPQLGAQVHRRWWVAQAAVASVRKDGQKLSLCLNNNTLVPVGRTFSAAIKARFANASKVDASGYV